MKTISAKILADTISPAGDRITTMELCYPRIPVHSQLMAYRLFARNARSSRAVPTATLLREVRDNPALPIFWGENQRGMVARSELSHRRAAIARAIVGVTRFPNLLAAQALAKLGLHKQTANRILEPWMWIHTVFTASYQSFGARPWENLFSQRIHEDAQPEFCELATLMRDALEDSIPEIGTVHLPYVNAVADLGLEDAIKVSAARCARVSYKPFGGVAEDIGADLRLAAKLLGARPAHLSPFEHPCTAFPGQCGPFYGWQSARSLLESPKGREPIGETYE